MYVVTFYSFKGGVGRSMALVNVGVQLAKAGKKVLLVDFDLEAPGLPTFNLDKPTQETLGIVDFVTHYIDRGEAPNIKEYLYKSSQFSGGGGIWVMPVGHQDATYSKRLNSINWKLLYSEQDGYLFFEDMRRQWDAELAPDYVLIDSRTGHSDVEGLCTRQLPNAVCLLFFPNEQNLQGLKRIVENIQHENHRSRKKIDLHFAVSNVPDLDDEERILGRTMARFQDELGYSSLAAEIHHYNSLTLLNQEIFSLTRPNSRLTKEYQQLAQAITKLNLSDRDTAVDLLKNAAANIAEVATSTGPESLLEKLDIVLKKFSQDGEVLYRVALVYAQIGNFSDALTLLSTDVVAKNFATSAMFATRARLRHRMSFNEEAKEDLARMLDAADADFESFLRANSDLNQLAPSLYERIPDSAAFRSLAPRDRVFLAFQFEGGPYQAEAKIRVLEEMLLDPPDNLSISSDDLQHEISLTLISQGKAEAAIKYLHPLALKTSARISEIFNFAMAMWSRDGFPPLDQFQRVADLSSGQRTVNEDSANYAECLAIVFAVLKQTNQATEFLKEARRRMQNRPKRELSAWSYSKVTPKEFLAHLDEIKLFVDGEKVLPHFMSKSDGLFDKALH